MIKYKGMKNFKIDNDNLKFKNFRNKKSKIYKNRVKEISNYIKNKINRTKLFEKYNNIYLLGNNIMSIVNSENDALRNIVNQFFKLNKKKCECCECLKEKGIERCHASSEKNFGRKDIAINVLNKMYVNEKKPISKKDFLINYVEEHSKYPLWFLCQDCHRIFDK